MNRKPVTATQEAQLSPQERAAKGRAARARASRSAHAEYTPSRHRPDPVDVIEEQSATRVPELVPIRYGRMSESPFRFYRGAAAIMAGDLATTIDSGLRAQLCGDAHMLNFRLLASPERHLLFDINDFDETLPGPWEWDVKRLAASLVIAGRENGFTDAERSVIVRSAVRSYREQMRRFAGMRTLDVWYSRSDADQLAELASGRLQKRGRKQLSRSLAKARTHDSLQAFEKLTHVVDGERRITATPPLITPLADLLPDMERNALEETIRGLIHGYRRSLQTDRQHLIEQFTLVDMARKVVGVGSVGTRCWIVLLRGRDGDDPLFLQAKEADVSALAPHVGSSDFATQGERVVAGQRLMQAASDIFLGWQRVHGIDGLERDFYVRQLRDWKFVVEPSLMVPQGMGLFAELCGATLARAHARSGDRIAIAAYLGSGDVFDRALNTFAETYADQNERDHQALLDAIKGGRVSAQAG
ncbi:DUF2252 domain-containing protein [Streptomyces lunaelactis]|uniref:DUF2252 domain-containing protein n=1 Tax=Streptomyces lunaelactis TaxID=1535768 RepID=UPI0015852E6D|nr:DUF2252 domain-containing protein [Streptomyces lunaelactis]NUK08256.1 DUF2252 domain-containing protein [Streptomyces lunaelactis]NUK22591.1 DUF2252 domain-containing protein [Streptomyces lunaelactis]NUK32589.1 DUF2252 domain-containing protein [Streptomyces lunaelactis]NUK45586.1 DUF2252 domain-containing protein [Streptomyces lunaelactis]NUK55884.1 DUF2252 domain-containing protein [Streptomyces lunaelactis]